jgi:hypothetical protein
MLSTVDTYLIVVSQSFVADAASFRYGLPHLRINQKTEWNRKLRRRVQLFTAVIPILSVGIFYLLNVVATQDTFTLYMIAGSLPFAALYIGDSQRRAVFAKSAAIAAGAALLVSIIANLIIARYALHSFSAIAFGLLYFIPLATSLVAAIPFVRLLRTWTKPAS